MAKRKGNQKPTQLFILGTRNSLYKEAVELYEKTGRKALTWQKNILKPIMTPVSKKNSLWKHTKFGLAVPRRNGKNEIIIMREFWGLVRGEKILHTAHRADTSHAAWERLCMLLDKADYTYSSIRAKGSERIVLDDYPDAGINFRTRTSKGGLGEGYDLVIIDEAQEYTPDQESALKYVVSDSKNPQTIFCGTPPTPLSSGTVFLDFRNSIFAGKTKNRGWAEWSVEEMSDVYDKDLWYLTNPSLGYILTERAIEDEIGEDEVDFNIQRLGLWIKYNQKSAITADTWNGLQVPKVPDLKGKLFAGIKYGNDGINVALSIAVKTKDNRIFVEVIDCRSVRLGNAWILDFLKKADIEEVVVDGAGNQQILAKEMKKAGLMKPTLPTVKQVIVANASFENAVYQGTICHKGQPSLADVVSNCEKRNIGSNGGFGYKAQIEEMDISLMDSVLLAHWACENAKSKTKQRIWY